MGLKPCGRVLARLATVISLGLVLASAGAPAALAQTTKDAAMKDYEATLVQADAAAASGDNFEAVRLYERAGRVAYNNKLDIDKAALDQKLAAARKARDTQKSPAGAAAPAASPATPRPETPVAAPANQDALQEYRDAVAEGDAYASVGENLIAVREYERARRLIYNNKLAVDGVALDAKIAAAAKARDTRPAPSTELVPPPPPPVPRIPGKETELNYVPERPGVVRPWSLHREPFVVSDMRATPAELAALEANLRRVAEVVLRTAAIHPPRGFEVYVSATLGEIESEQERKAHLAQHQPLLGDFYVGFLNYFEMRSPSRPGGAAKSEVFTQEELACGLRFNFNSPPMPGLRFDDAEGTFLPEPRKDGEIGGQPVYGGTLVVAPPGTTFWVPVTTRRVLAYLVPEYRKAAGSGKAMAAQTRQSYEDVLRPEAMARRRAEEAAARAKGGAGAEQNAHHLEVMNRRYEDDARKALAAGASDRNARERADIYREAEALLASNNSAVLDAPACAMIPAHDGLAAWKLVPQSTAGCTPIVTPNPKLRNPKLPRTALQILYLNDITWSTRILRESIPTREEPGDCVAATNVIRQLDWKALQALLER